MEIASLVPSTLAGYLVFRLATNPNSKIWIRLSKRSLKSKRIQIFPSIRIYAFGRYIHFHHWFNFSILLIYSFIASAGFLDYMVTRGILIGGIIQGLSLPREHWTMIYKDHPSLPKH